MSNSDLTNKENYRQIISDDYNTVANSYIFVVIECMKIFNEKLVDAYNVTKGIETITHVFIMMLLYTKNLKCAVYYSQKAYYFFVEFIEQITNGQNTFLQLTTTDATVFVYKKTIFEISHANVCISLSSDLDKIHDLKILANTIKTMIRPHLTCETFQKMMRCIPLTTSKLANVCDFVKMLDNSELTSQSYSSAMQLFLSMLNSEKKFKHLNADSMSKILGKDYAKGVKQLFME
jgi:hypothetical protein